MRVMQEDVKEDLRVMQQPSTGKHEGFSHPQSSDEVTSLSKKTISCSKETKQEEDND